MGTGRPQGMSEATAGTYTALFPSSSFFRILPLHHVIGFKYIFPIILFKTHFDALDLLVVFLRSQLFLVATPLSFLAHSFIPPQKPSKELSDEFVRVSGPKF